MENLVLSTSLPGRLRNTSLPKAHGLLPLFEAVVNSIQAIDSTFPSASGGRIEIRIIRYAQDALSLPIHGRVPLEPIVKIVIRDNGAGFHSANMESFETLDSEYKLSQGGRGVGRLLWLKAFRRVEVESCFKEGDEWKLRRFRFTAQDGIIGHELEEAMARETFAEVRLIGFDGKYQKSSRKLPSTIARDLLEHCLWYFVREGGAPDILLFDQDEVFDLDQLFNEYMRSSAHVDQFQVKGTDFDLIHLKLKASAKQAPSISWCASNRVVLEENISGKIPGLHGLLADNDGDFIYSGYLTSEFLDEYVRPERTGFDLAEFPETSRGEKLMIGSENIVHEELSKSEIREAVLNQVGQFLSVNLDAAREEGRARVEEFVSTKAPRYRPVLSRIDRAGFSVDPGLSDRDLELELHKRYSELEAEVLREGQVVLEQAGLSSVDEAHAQEYSERLSEYLAKVDDVKKSDLAAYVSRRKTIIDLLAKIIEQQPDGTYSREDRVHNLIMPMRTTSEDPSHGASNLWLVDERLTFHNYLASDRSLQSMPITGSTSLKKPDIAALQLCDIPILIAEGSSPTWASLSIIEIKRPMRNDAGSGLDRDPIEQCLDYLQRIRSGGVRTAKGRPIPNSDKVPGFCYIISDLTSTLMARCRMHRLNPTHDGMGYFGYHDTFDAYIEVMSFDRLVSVVNQRNRAFFDAIGLPAT